MGALFSIGVFGIIFDEEKKVLLCHRRDYDLWNLPGGGVEQGETPWDGLKREVKEETGLEVEIIRLSGVYSKSEKNEIVFAFICKPIKGKVTITDEADKVEYFDVNELPTNTVPKQVERIKDVFENPNTIAFKVQTGISSIDLNKESKH